MAQPFPQISLPKEVNAPKMTLEEKKELAEINEDCYDMDRYADVPRKHGAEAVQGYMALSTGQYPDNRSRIFVPKIHAIVHSRMAMEAANIPRVVYKHRHPDSEKKMKFINAAKINAEQGDISMRASSEHLWFNQNFDKILLGVGFRYLSYLYQERIVKIKDDNGKLKEKKMVVYDDIWDENLDFFNVGVSRDMQPGMFGGSSAYFDKYYSKDHFMERFGNENYHDIEYAASRDDWLKGESTRSWSVPKGYVRVRNWYHLYTDKFFVLANGVIIRKDFILDYGNPDRPKKFIPITSLHNNISYDLEEPVNPNFINDGRQYSDVSKSSTNRSFWSKGDARLVKGLIGFSNAMWRAAVDNTKASSVHFLLAKSPGVYDQITTSDLYGIKPIKGASGDSFDVKSLADGSTYLNKFEGMEQAVDNMMTFALGNDWKRTAQEFTNEKATVAAIRQQVQKIHMAQNSKYNETGPIKRHYRILLNLIQQYYTIKMLRELGGSIPEGTNEMDIIRDRDGNPVAAFMPKEIPIEKAGVQVMRGGKLDFVGEGRKEARGKVASRSFLAHKEFIVSEEEPEIYVEPGSTFAELKAIDKAQDIELLNVLSQFFSLQYPDGPLIPREGAEAVLEKIAKDYDMDPDSLLGRIVRGKGKGIDAVIPEPFQGGLFAGMQNLPGGAMSQFPTQNIPAAGAAIPQGVTGLAGDLKP